MATWEDLAACFSGLKADLVTDADVNAAISDVRAWLGSKYASGQPLLEPLYDPTLTAFHDYLTKATELGNSFDYSMGARALLRNERRRISLLLDAGDLAKSIPFYGKSMDSSIVSSLKETLQELRDKWAKVGIDTYPAPAVKLFDAVESLIDAAHVSSAPAVAETVEIFGVQLFPSALASMDSAVAKSGSLWDNLKGWQSAEGIKTPIVPKVKKWAADNGHVSKQITVAVKKEIADTLVKAQSPALQALVEAVAPAATPASVVAAPASSVYEMFGKTFTKEEAEKLVTDIKPWMLKDKVPPHNVVTEHVAWDTYSKGFIDSPQASLVEYLKVEIGKYPDLLAVAAEPVAAAPVVAAVAPEVEFLGFQISEASLAYAEKKVADGGYIIDALEHVAEDNGLSVAELINKWTASKEAAGFKSTLTHFNEVVAAAEKTKAAAAVEMVDFAGLKVTKASVEAIKDAVEALKTSPGAGGAVGPLQALAKANDIPWSEVLMSWNKSKPQGATSKMHIIDQFDKALGSVPASSLVSPIGKVKFFSFDVDAEAAKDILEGTGSVGNKIAALENLSGLPSNSLYSTTVNQWGGNGDLNYFFHEQLGKALNVVVPDTATPALPSLKAFDSAHNYVASAALQQAKAGNTAYVMGTKSAEIKGALQFLGFDPDTLATMSHGQKAALFTAYGSGDTALVEGIWKAALEGKLPKVTVTGYQVTLEQINAVKYALENGSSASQGYQTAKALGNQYGFPKEWFSNTATNAKKKLDPIQAQLISKEKHALSQMGLKQGGSLAPAPSMPTPPAFTAPSVASPSVAVPTAPAKLADPLDQFLRGVSWKIDPTITIPKSTNPLKVLLDEEGDRWLFKTPNSGNRFISDNEDGAHKIGRLFGRNMADSFVGQHTADTKSVGFFQRMFKNEGTLGKGESAISPSKLSQDQLSDIVSEHVFDWLIANDDTHGDNLMRLTNGRIVGIDKGRAYRHIGKDRLSLGTLDTNTETYYTKLYSYLSKRPQPEVDRLYFSAMREAQDMARVSDVNYRIQLQRTLASRTDFSATGGKTREAVIQLALDRKNNLAKDIDSLWSEIYQRTGLAKPKVPVLLSGGNVGVSQELVESIVRAEAHGTAAMFAGPDLEDAHMIFWREKSSNGKSYILRSDARVRKEADARLQAWLQTKVSGYSGSVPAAVKLPNQTAYLQPIIDAAKTVSHHVSDGLYNPSKMQAFDAVKSKIESELATIANGGVPTGVKLADLPQYSDMLEYYKGHVAGVENLIASKTKSTIGQFPEFTYVPEKLVAAPEPLSSVIVTKVDTLKETATYDAATGTLKSTGKTQIKVKRDSSTYQMETGERYIIKLPGDGVEIEYRTFNDGAPITQKGTLRFKIENWDGTPEKIDKAVGQLREMGLDLQPPDEQDLELFYWRHLGGVASQRLQNSKIQEVLSYAKTNISSKSFNTKADEIAAWRDAWGLLDKKKVDEWVAKRGYLPHFSHVRPQDPTFRGGRPWWYRFDVDYKKLKSDELLIQGIKPQNTITLLETGGAYSTEERPRILGEWYAGSSSVDDQKSGGAGWVFTRQNIDQTSDYSGMYGATFYIRPEVAARTSSYSFGSDLFGRHSDRPTNAHWDFQKAQQHTAKTNEVMVKANISFLDDIEIAIFDNDVNRNKAIDFLRSHGVTEIRNVPVQERFLVANNKLSAQRARAFKLIKEVRRNAVADFD